MSKEQEIMAFLEARVFGPALAAPKVPQHVRAGVRQTRVRMSRLPAVSMVNYFWSAATGKTDRALRMGEYMKAAGLTRFESEEVLCEFRTRFDPSKWGHKRQHLFVK
jgi:hypothetical protein